MNTIADPAAGAPPSTAEEFLGLELPPKQPLIDGLLYRRDIVALAGRRRHGKTTFIFNLVAASVLPLPAFLGYSIPNVTRALVYFLEDDDSELQIKLRRILKGRASGGRLALRTRTDFYRDGIPISVRESRFQNRVMQDITAHKPDLIVFDNLAHLIGADYNDPKHIHHLVRFTFQLTSAANAAVIIAAHPRKRNGKEPQETKSLADDPEVFFEEVMGSSHFVNSCGSLWGLERNADDRTTFCGGAQRFTGQQSAVKLEKDGDDWFQIVGDLDESAEIALNTPTRQKAWGLLPKRGFTYTEGEMAVKPAMKSGSTFSEWFRTLIRTKMVVVEREGTYRKSPLLPTHLQINRDV